MSHRRSRRILPTFACICAVTPSNARPLRPGQAQSLQCAVHSAETRSIALPVTRGGAQDPSARPIVKKHSPVPRLWLAEKPQTLGAQFLVKEDSPVPCQRRAEEPQPLGGKSLVKEHGPAPCQRRAEEP
ncbi:hypothetical protein NDU88_007270 [Pleurodeles waltl]|uniref:Secreted protein n=1 Tax=Pleurodeles waltl TaxID=8319 RepID=A0AAV7TZX1_PLEWA|nr:hypothetical protein NDU88_007270 [Pleurodeles waltl]